MTRVFVSHAAEDAGLAGQVHRWLVEDGHEAFLDQDLWDGIAIGEDWQPRLHERLRWADAMVCVITSAYRDSTWCAAEVGIAQSRGSRLLPIRAEPGVVHPLLISTQYLDLNGDAAAARARLAIELRRLDAAGGTGWPDDRSPFPGLRPYKTDHHRVFFGRKCEASELAALLRSQAERAVGAILLVVGPSGCGKSSLVRAGLMPVMAADADWWTVPAFTPGADPVGALTRELTATARQAGLSWTLAEVHDRLANRGLAETADELLLATAGGRRRRLLLVVDQFEELLTQSAAGQRARFADLLNPALSSSVQVVATLRPEFLDLALVDPNLAALPTHGYMLRPLHREALRAVIEGPAAMAGIGVDDELISRLVEDTGSGEALPLLAYALAELADGVERGGRLLISRYERLGGVQAALARQADAALADAVATTGRTPNQVIKELLRLVTVDEQGHPTRWRVRRNDLPAPVTAELDAFVTRRLLTTDTENGETIIGVAHEAFLSAWPPLTAAITAAASALRARRALEHAATEWVESGHPRERLWERGQLAAAVNATGAHLVKRPRQFAPSSGEPATPNTRPSRLRPRHRVVVTDRVELSAPAREFLRASIRRDRRQRQRGVTILSLLLVLALGAAGVALVQQQTAQQRQRVATARQLLAQAQGILRDDPRTALQLGEAALSIHDSPETRVGLTNTLLGTRFRDSFETQAESPTAADFSSGAHTLATTTTNTVTLWNLIDPLHPQRLSEFPNGHSQVMDVAVAPNGKTLATASNDDTLLLWDVNDAAHPRLLSQPPTGPHYTYAMAFTADGGTLATINGDAFSLWDLNDAAHPARLGGELLAGGQDILAFAPDGRTLVTAGADTFDKSVNTPTILWDLTNPARPTSFGEFPGSTRVIAVAFSPDGRTLATGSDDGTVILWDVTDRAHPSRLGDPLPEKSGSKIAFAPNGRTLATAGYDTTLLWDLTDPAHPYKLGQPLTGHDSEVLALAFTPDGQSLTTAGRDRTAILWDVTDPERPLALGEPIPFAGGDPALTPDGRLLAAATWEQAILWNLSDTADPSPLASITFPVHTSHPSPGVTSTSSEFQLLAMALAPNGRTLATAGAVLNEGGKPPGPGIATLWDLSDPVQPRRLSDLTGHEAIDALAFTPDGRTLVTASRDSTAILWDLTNPAHPTRYGEPGSPHSNWVTAVRFAPDGHTLATASADRTAGLWDMTDPAKHAPRGNPLTGHTDVVEAVAFAPDGRTLATTSRDRTIILWDLSDPDNPTRLGDRLTGHNASVTAAAFAPNGRTLATTGEDGTVILWDVTDRAHPGRLGDTDDPLIGYPSGMRASVAFEPDGGTLVVAGAGAMIWDLNKFNDIRADPMKYACAITGHGLNQAEWARYISDLPHIDSCA